MVWRGVAEDQAGQWLLEHGGVGVEVRGATEEEAEKRCRVVTDRLVRALGGGGGGGRRKRCVRASKKTIRTNASRTRQRCHNPNLCSLHADLLRSIYMPEKA